MKIYRTVNPVAYENTYYLENDHSLILVDPGSDWATIQKQIDRIGKPIVAILLTHTHYDHIMSLEKVRQTYHFPPVYVHSAEASWLSSPVDNLSGLDRHADLEDVVCKEADFLYDIRSDYQKADFHFYVLETPGHSAGGVSIVFPEDHLVLSGDALFRETIGRTDLPTGNAAQLLSSIREELFTLPSSYTVYPGHGPETSIGHEKMFNPFFRQS